MYRVDFDERQVELIRTSLKNDQVGDFKAYVKHWLDTRPGEKLPLSNGTAQKFKNGELKRPNPPQLYSLYIYCIEHKLFSQRDFDGEGLTLSSAAYSMKSRFGIPHYNKLQENITKLCGEYNYVENNICIALTLEPRLIHIPTAFWMKQNHLANVRANTNLSNLENNFYFSSQETHSRGNNTVIFEGVSCIFKIQESIFLIQSLISTDTSEIRQNILEVNSTSEGGIITRDGRLKKIPRLKEISKLDSQNINMYTDDIMTRPYSEILKDCPSFTDNEPEHFTLEEKLWVAVLVGTEEEALALFKQGVDVNYQNRNSGRTFLHQALRRSMLKLAKELLKTGKVDLSLKDNGGWRAINWEKYAERTEIWELAEEIYGIDAVRGYTVPSPTIMQRLKSALTLG